MGLKLERQKDKNLWFSIIYRIARHFPLSDKNKLRLFMNLDWIFKRLAHEWLYAKSNKDALNLLPPNEFFKQVVPDRCKVLDVGCGRGYSYHIIKDKITEYTGVDKNSDSLAYAKNTIKTPNAKFVCDNLYHFLKGSRETYDVVILSHILEHLQNPESFLSSLVPYTDHFYIECPDFDTTPHNHIRVGLNSPFIYSDEDHLREFDRIELANLIEDAGLEILECEYRYEFMRYWCKVSRDSILTLPNPQTAL